jgi:phosphoesterase RecJ-like protein
MLGDDSVDGFVPGRDEARVREADTIVVLDINRWDRLGGLSDLIRDSDAAKLCIDHHPRPELFGAHDVSEPSAAATGALIYDLIETWVGDIPADVIVPLYAAVMTDTGSFRFANTNPRALEIGSDLVRRGVRPNDVFREIYESSSPARMRLLGEVLRALEYEADGRVVHFTITDDLLRACNVDRDDADGFTDVVRNVRGSQVVISFVETEDGGTKISLRSKGETLNVSEIANEFGGGGHVNASGIADARPLDVAKADILDTVIERLTISREV